MEAGHGAGGEEFQLRGGNSIPRARKAHCARVSAGAGHCMTEGLKGQWAPRLLCSGQRSGGETSLTARSVVSPAGKSAEADRTASVEKSAGWRGYSSSVKPTENLSACTGPAECRKERGGI